MHSSVWALVVGALLCLQVCVGGGELLGLTAAERRQARELWDRSFPDRKAEKAWMIKIMDSPPLSDVPKFLHWNFSSTHQKLSSIFRHLDKDRTVQNLIMSLAAFHEPPPLDSAPSTGSNPDNWKAGREVDTVKCYMGLSLMVGNLNIMYINVLKRRLVPHTDSEWGRSLLKAMGVLKDKIAEYNERKLSERYLAVELDP